MAYNVTQFTDYVDRASEVLTRTMFSARETAQISSFLGGVKGSTKVPHIGGEATFQTGNCPTPSGSRIATEVTLSTEKITVFEDFCQDDIQNKFPNTVLPQGSNVGDSLAPWEEKLVNTIFDGINRKLELHYWQGDISTGDYQSFDGFLKKIDADSNVNVVDGNPKSYAASAPEVKATATVTLVDVVPTDLVNINGLKYTFVATASNAGEVSIGADDTADAANLASAINGDSRQGTYGAVSATSALGVVTLTSNLFGQAGNQVTLSSPDTTISGSSATFVGGQDAQNGITIDNVVDIVEGMYYNAPSIVRQQDDFTILCGYDVFDLYIQALRKENLYHYSVDNQNGEYRIPGIGKRLKAIYGLDGTDRLIASRPTNFWVGGALENEDQLADIFYDQTTDKMNVRVKFYAGVAISNLDEIVEFSLA